MLLIGCQATTNQWTAKSNAVADAKAQATPNSQGAVGSQELVALSAAGPIPAPSRGRGDRLSVLTFNMEHKDKPEQLDVMAQRLRSDLAEVPDFILLQEVMFERSSYKGEANTAEVLGGRLGFYTEGTKR